MSKAHHTSKDLKKKPLLTPKEKKTAKNIGVRSTIDAYIQKSIGLD